MYNEKAQRRYELLKELENEYSAKIITLIGTSLHSRLDMRAARKVIRNLRIVGSQRRVIIFLNTYGGEIEAGWRIAREIIGRPAETTIIVTSIAKSTGTLIALSGTEIIARNNSEFGPADPQIPVRRSGQQVYLPARKLLYSEDEFEREIAEKAIKQAKGYLQTILQRRIQDANKIEALLEMLLQENVELEEVSHITPIFPTYLRDLGVNIRIEDMPKFCELLELYEHDSEGELLQKETHLVEMLSI